jgi:DNA-binding NarL/FixJ family response regulator
MSQLRALVADNAPTRFGVRLALQGVAEVCAEAEDRVASVRAAAASKPDIALVGRSLPGGGVEAVREICTLVPTCAVVVLADSDCADDLLDSLRAGAIGYMPVGFEPIQLRRAVSAVRTQQAAIPRSMVRDLIDEIRVAERAAEGDLTARETQVLTMLRRGHSTQRIAGSLSISPITVRRHISVVMHKVGVSQRADLLDLYASPHAAHMNQLNA